MKVTVSIYEIDGEFIANIFIEHPLLNDGWDFVATTKHKSKGQLKRKVIQFCSQLNLEVEFKL